MYSEELKTTIKEHLKATLSPHRYQHVLGVAQAARQLAEKYGCDADS